MEPTESMAQIDRLATQAWREFDAVADFMWKIPSFVEQQREIELLKLFTYFPEDEEGREFRWRHESQKLDGVFPFLISTGNLFSLIALLEVYLLQLCHLIEVSSGVTLKDVKGQGFRRLLAHLRMVGVEPSKVPFWQQVDSALKIRHCFTHSSGFLAYSREDIELRRIARDRIFLSPEHRESRKGKDNEELELAIVPTPLGDRLQIRIYYSFLLSAYVRDFFVGVCEAAMQGLQGTNRGISEAPLVEVAEENGPPES